MLYPPLHVSRTCHVTGLLTREILRQVNLERIGGDRIVTISVLVSVADVNITPMFVTGNVVT